MSIQSEEEIIKEKRRKFYTNSPEVGIKYYNYTRTVSFNMYTDKDVFANIETQEVIANDANIILVAEKAIPNTVIVDRNENKDDFHNIETLEVIKNDDDNLSIVEKTIGGADMGIFNDKTNVSYNTGISIKEMRKKIHVAPRKRSRQKNESKNYLS